MNKILIFLIIISIILFIFTHNIWYGIILIGLYAIIKIVFNLFSQKI